MAIRSLEARDVEAILAIQAACPEIAQWTAWDYDRVARGEMAGWVATENSAAAVEAAAEVADEVAPEVAGFLLARRLSSDLEILNFAVESEWRRCGIGATLLTAALQWAQTFQATRAILEVRASNLAALRFYQRHKFEVAGRRPRYYTAPVEDALLLTRRLFGASQGGPPTNGGMVPIPEGRVSDPPLQRKSLRTRTRCISKKPPYNF